MTWYARFIRYAPDAEKLRDHAVLLDTLLRTGDVLLKAFVIGAWFYFAIEIGHGLFRYFGGR